ncbi:MAG: hypothetical protein A2Y80_10430 [Deltaproteobacteria bacterium RBG_13_58_19]|nr:MAG: hypothetical protein A2Y80_10430 [Deltaproteobacteria bacterium RBG_13_58_19]
MKWGEIHFPIIYIIFYYQAYLSCDSHLSMIDSRKKGEKLIYDPAGMAFTLELPGEMAAATAAAEWDFVPDRQVVECLRGWA